MRTTTMAALTGGTVARQAAHGSDGVGLIGGAAAAVRQAAIDALGRAADEGLTLQAAANASTNPNPNPNSNPSTNPNPNPNQAAANASGYKGVYPCAHAWYQALHLLWLYLLSMCLLWLAYYDWLTLILTMTA